MAQIHMLLLSKALLTVIFMGQHPVAEHIALVQYLQLIQIQQEQHTIYYTALPMALAQIHVLVLSKALTVIFMGQRIVAEHLARVQYLKLLQQEHTLYYTPLLVVPPMAQLHMLVLSKTLTVPFMEQHLLAENMVWV